MKIISNNTCKLISESYQIISYVTDIEGNWDYWNRFLSISKIIYRKSVGFPIAFKDEKCHLVFGGDICDRGPGDIRILNDLLQLKRDYPDKVHFINGNRDINKMRLRFEVDIPSLLDDTPEVFWIPISPNECKMKNQSKVERLKWVI